MLEKTKSLFFLLILVFGVFGGSAAWAQTNDSTKIRNKLIDYGTDRKVAVTMRDKTVVKGKLTSIGTDTFTVTDGKTGNVQTISYGDVAKVKRTSITKWIVIGAVAGVGAVLLLTLNSRCRSEGNNSLCL